MASLQAHLAVCMIKWRVKRRLKNCRDYRLARQILRPPPCKTPASVRITNAKVNGIPGEWLESPNSAQSVLLYLHGGGYFGCSAETHRPITAWFAMHGFRIFAPNYRLAPENPCGGRDRELENLAGRSTRLATRAALDSRSSPIATRSSRFPSQACCRRDLAWCTMDARCLSPPATATTLRMFLSTCPSSARAFPASAWASSCLKLELKISSLLKRATISAALNTKTVIPAAPATSPPIFILFRSKETPVGRAGSRAGRKSDNT